MTTTTLPDTGLDWVTFSDDDRTKQCQYVSHSCTAQATHVGTYRLAPGCPHPSRRLYCLGHRDMILRLAVPWENRFRCPHCWPPYLAIAVLLSMEAL